MYINYCFFLILMSHVNDSEKCKVDSVLDDRCVKNVNPNSIRKLSFGKLNWNFETMLVRSQSVRKEYVNMKSVTEKIWYIKSKIRIKTHLNQWSSVCNCPLPNGVSIISNPFPDLLKGTRNDMVRLFSHEQSLKKNLRIPFADYRKSRGLYYIFGFDVETETFTKFSKAIKMLEKYEHLHMFCQKYADFLCSVFGISMRLFENEVMLLLLKYEKEHGLWLHVDNVARTDGVPICTISIGPPDVNVDFVPVVVPNATKIPMRLNLNEGDMLMMQGESRYEWAHGIPYGLGSEKYTVMFKFNRMEEKIKVVGYSHLLDTDMYEMSRDSC